MPGASDALSVGFDCGDSVLARSPPTARRRAQHHATRGGREFLVDPGTYDYFTHPEWRAYFRSTAAHNTVRLDGTEQSTPLGLFLWGSRAQARCDAFEPSASGGVVVGEHDGYARLAQPATHRRRVEVDAAAGRVLVQDEIDSAGTHDVEIPFPLAEHVRSKRSRDTLRSARSKSRVPLELDQDLPDRPSTAPPCRASAGESWLPRQGSFDDCRCSGRSQGRTRFSCVLTRV